MLHRVFVGDIGKRELIFRDRLIEAPNVGERRAQIDSGLDHLRTKLQKLLIVLDRSRVVATLLRLNRTAEKPVRVGLR